jgi:type IV fimbrial biogenesis protein FimT
MRTPLNARLSKGVTLIEAMVAIAILAILGSIGIPSFMNTMDRARITGVADNLLTNIKLVQTEASKTNQNATITFTPGANWSYTTNTTPAISVTGGEYRGTSITSGTQLTAASNVLTFEPRRNTLIPRAAAGAGPITLLTIQSARGHSVSFTVASNSAIVVCTNSSLRGYPAC